MSKNNTVLMPHNKEIFDKLVTAFKAVNDVVLIHGTGMGKSYLLIELLNQLFSYSRILYVTPKHAIKENFTNYDAYKESGLNIVFKTYNYFDNGIKVAKAYDDYDFFIFDEAHHMGSELYGNNTRELLEMVKASENKKALGLTATNQREDKTDIADFFSSTVLGISIFEGIEQGLIPPFEYLVCGNDAVDRLETGKTFYDYRTVIEYETGLPLFSETVRKNPKDKWLCYFTNVLEVEMYEELIRDIFPDDYHILKITSRHSTTISEVFDYDKVVILSVNKLLEGIHLPDIEGIILFRNVGSLPVFQQMLGRLVHIGSKNPPLFLDCTETAFKMLQKLTPREKGSRNSDNDNDRVKKILYCSIQNIEHFNLQELLLAHYQTTRSFEYNGVLYKSVSDCCKTLQLSFSAVNSYKNRHQISYQEAIDIDTKKENTNNDDFNYRNKKGFNYNGVEYENVSECCNKLGLIYKNVTMYKKRHHISYQEAIDYYTNKEGFVYEGIQYNSIAECCKKLQICRCSVFVYKRKNNVTYQEAIDYYRIKKDKKVS